MEASATTHKFVAVLNRKVEPGRLMNALAHVTAGLLSTATPEEKETMGFVDYLDSNGDNLGSMSKNGFIILSADNSNQLRTLRNAAKSAGMRTIQFTNTTCEGTYLDQIKNSAETAEESLEYFAIAMFGEKGALSALTKKFSLWR